MGIRCGIVGLPNVGKSTLFNAITAAGADASNYPFCTIEPNVGIVAVPDPRLDTLGVLLRPPRLVPTTIEFVDIAGLVRGASKGEGLGNQFLAAIREVDAIVHVVRCFEDPNVVHVDGRIDPQRDIEVVETELVLKDLETVERRLAEAAKKAKVGDKSARGEAAACERLCEHLAGARLARYWVAASEEEQGLLRELHLLTAKPVMYVCNVGESQDIAGNPGIRAVEEAAAKEGAKVVVVSAEVEAEIAELSPEDQKAFRASLGMQESGLTRLIREGYDLLELVTFFTFGPKEARAWTVRRGTHAARAAGMIHTDFERGFICAEVMRFDDLQRFGSDHAVRDHGLLRQEGRDYAVQDGDVVFFRFNV